VTDLQKSQKNANFMGNGDGWLKDGGKNGFGKGGGVGNGNGLWMDKGANGFAMAGGMAKGGAGTTGAVGGAMAKSGGCCLFHGFWCSRCCWFVFLLGLLLGALITGLITGLILGARLEGKKTK